jgi:predicted PurR-regulated permease PerM
MKVSSGKSLIEQLIPVTLLAALIAIAAMTLLPFLPAILWAAMVATSIAPLFERLAVILGGRRTLAAWLTGIALMLIFVVPAIALGRALLAYLPGALTWIENIAAADYRTAPGPIYEFPAIGPHLAALWEAIFSDSSNTAARFQAELKNLMVWAIAEVELLGAFIFEFFIGVILAVILVHRSKSVSALSLRFFNRAGGTYGERLALLAARTTRQAVFGVLGAALAQTLVATFSYVVAGVPGWIIWALVTYILSLVQIGPILVWLPMSLWLWASNEPLMAAFVFFWGLLVVNITDNIIRPLLVAKDSNLPASLAFLGAVGGLLAWGVVGVFLGPVILAVAYELLLNWLGEQEQETAQKSGI